MKRAILILIIVTQFISLYGQGRKEIDFNTDWQFVLEDELQFRNPQFDASNWSKIDLPHDWSIQSDFSDAFPAGNAGGALPGGIGWYRKEFVTDKLESNKQISIHFGGSYRYTEVWLN